jgi:hypothetical protein
LNETTAEAGRSIIMPVEGLRIVPWAASLHSEGTQAVEREAAFLEQAGGNQRADGVKRLARLLGRDPSHLGHGVDLFALRHNTHLAKAYVVQATTNGVTANAMSGSS